MASKERKERVYEPIWKALKTIPNHVVELHVLPGHVSRVKKAVSKEKLKDATTAFLNKDNGDSLRLQFEYSRETRVLKIKVRQSVGIDDMVV